VDALIQDTGGAWLVQGVEDVELIVSLGGGVGQLAGENQAGRSTLLGQPLEGGQERCTSHLWHLQVHQDEVYIVFHDILQRLRAELLSW